MCGILGLYEFDRSDISSDTLPDGIEESGCDGSFGPECTSAGASEPARRAFARQCFRCEYVLVAGRAGTLPYAGV
jgi:hypothetical protein